MSASVTSYVSNRDQPGMKIHNFLLLNDQDMRLQTCQQILMSFCQFSGTASIQTSAGILLECHKTKLVGVKLIMNSSCCYYFCLLEVVNGGFDQAGQ